MGAWSGLGLGLGSRVPADGCKGAEGVCKGGERGEPTP